MKNQNNHFYKMFSPEQLAKIDATEPGGPIPGLIPYGLTFLTGPKFSGKSFLMLQAGCALGSAGQFLGLALRPGRVLYYALEDTPGDLRERIVRQGMKPDTRIDYCLALRPLHLGGLEELDLFALRGEYDLIVIDSFRRALMGLDLRKEAVLFENILFLLRKVAVQNRLAIAAIQPTFARRPAVDAIVLELARAADCMLEIQEGPVRMNSTLSVRLKGMEEVKLAIWFDTETFTWQLME